jgi:predicted alpha/beta superfamily hydrolase
MRLFFQYALSVALTAMWLVASYESRAQTIASDDSAIAPLDFLPALAGDYFRLDSEVIGRAFHIYVNLPQSYDTESGQAYPVVFVLDGDSLFPVIAPTHLFLTIDNDVPEAVIVGIAYGSVDPSINMRGYDFTAPAPDTNSAQGGAPDFHMFLTEELIPLIERRYRVDSSRRILFGQSRGGGMVLYSAFSDPDVFWGRIANNPTFDPGREMFFSPPEDAARDDLGLVVTSGSNDMPFLREAALEWFSAWDAADELAWRLHMVTIEGGTHASYSPDSYRSGILWLFGLHD